MTLSGIIEASVPSTVKPPKGSVMVYFSLPTFDVAPGFTATYLSPWFGPAWLASGPAFLKGSCYGPAMVTTATLDSILPPVVQTALSALQADLILRFGSWWEPIWFNLATGGWVDLLGFARI